MEVEAKDKRNSKKERKKKKIVESHSKLNLKAKYISQSFFSIFFLIFIRAARKVPNIHITWMCWNRVTHTVKGKQKTFDVEA